MKGDCDEFGGEMKCVVRSLRLGSALLIVTLATQRVQHRNGGVSEPPRCGTFRRTGRVVQLVENPPAVLMGGQIAKPAAGLDGNRPQNTSIEKVTVDCLGTPTCRPVPV